MGTLSLPATGPVYVDVNAVIYAVEKIEPYASLLQPLWAKANAGELNIVTSELTWLESLTKPISDGNATLEKLFRAFLSAREITLIPATLSIWEKAARLRSLGLKTPDALHAATALASGCTMFLTNDAGFQRLASLPVTVLSVVLAP
jgi:predicted nucleic acid-binding protein